MSAVMTYDSLVTDVQTYLERTDVKLVTQTPRLIMMAEMRLATELKGLGFTQVVTGNFQSGSNTYPKPARWREMISFNYIIPATATAAVQRIELLPRAYEYLRNFWPDPTQRAAPRFYADYDYNNLLIAAPPDQDYAFEMLYYSRIQPLDSSNQTNWLTVNAPQLILYATLLEAQPWLRNDSRIPTWQALFEQSLSAVKTEDLRRIADRSAVITKGSPNGGA